MKPALAVSAATIAVLGISCAAGALAAAPPPVPALDAQRLPPQHLVPLENDGSAGAVTFTFDDGPDSWTPALLTELERLHLRAVFFAEGFKALRYPRLIRREIADGDLVENHTYDHLSLTGASTGTPALSPAKITAELTAGDDAITAAGAPQPVLYRPPFGDITAADNLIAARLGLRIAEPFSVVPGGAPVDSRDWTGISAAQIAADVTGGYQLPGEPFRVAGIHAGSVIGFHDSSPGTCLQQEPLCGYVRQTLLSLPLIVAFMNAHHLGVSTDIVPDATGGVVPPLFPDYCPGCPGGG